MKKVFVVLILTTIVLNAYSQATIGLLQKEAGIAEGYILFAPLQSKTTYLIDRCGKLVHSWKSAYKPGQSVYLLPDGNLLRSGNDSNMAFISGGGRIEKLDWNSNVIWSYANSTPTSCLHHDIYPMPNGNVLAILWEKKTPEEVKALGRNPDLISKSIWMEKIIELKPQGKNKAAIVWEWNICDHLVEDINNTLKNYGDVAKNPQLVNINYRAKVDEDWLHFNSVSYNSSLDQIIISNRNFCEFFIIDHSTTSAQAASHSGGRYKKGGDLLYRWGNAAAYNCGTPEEQKLYLQHSAHWISKGLVDEGKIMVFNNGTERPGEIFSDIEIIEPPIDKIGNYTMLSSQACKPSDSFWKYPEPFSPEKFYSKNVSNAQRLPNGNTLICEGANGRIFEINATGNRLWNYVNPVEKNPMLQGAEHFQNQIFRGVFYDLKYSGFKGRTLKTGNPIELNPVNTNCIPSAN
jgi:Arylsulfotransferase (ASST)